jgi:hypothetical protein
VINARVQHSGYGSAQWAGIAGGTYSSANQATTEIYSYNQTFPGTIANITVKG